MKRAFVFIGFLLVWVVALGAQSVPNPTVIGPIPATAVPGDPSHNYPFFSTNIDLAARGYVEEEFFFEGTANTYNLNPAVPSMATANIVTTGNVYRTRMIVRRPINAEDFNGTVIMEWQNVTGGYEIDALWIASHDHLMRRGYAWIGVSVQRAGTHTLVTGLRAWNPARYGTLDLTVGGTITNDALMWDIFSQAGQAVRHPQGVDPMGGLSVEHIFAGGYSQSSQRLSSYHNSIHPLAQIFDAIVLVGVDGPVLRPLRTDQSVKVFKFLTETNVAGNPRAISQALLRQQDSNTDHFRKWEVAGAAQLPYWAMQEVEPLQARDLPPSPPLTCDLPPLSRIPWHFVLNAAYDHMVEWVKSNVEPPIGPDIEVVSVGTISVLARDTYGNALGGIRLSQIEVPTATNTGLNGPATNSCHQMGTFVPFDQATLDALYPHHGAYVSQVDQKSYLNLGQGFIVVEDAISTIQNAAQSAIGKK